MLEKVPEFSDCYELVRDSNTTVSMDSVYGNMSTGTAFFITYPPSVR